MAARVLMADATHYEVLGVHPTASDAELRKAWRSLVSMTHPDKCDDPHATRAFQKVSASYDFLKDPERRQRYDRKEMMEDIKKMSEKWIQALESERAPLQSFSREIAQVSKELAENAALEMRCASTLQVEKDKYVKDVARIWLLRKSALDQLEVARKGLEVARLQPTPLSESLEKMKKTAKTCLWCALGYRKRASLKRAASSEAARSDVALDRLLTQHETPGSSSILEQISQRARAYINMVWNRQCQHPDKTSSSGASQPYVPTVEDAIRFRADLMNQLTYNIQQGNEELRLHGEEEERRHRAEAEESKARFMRHEVSSVLNRIIASVEKALTKDARQAAL